MIKYVKNLENIYHYVVGTKYLSYMVEFSKQYDAVLYI